MKYLLSLFFSLFFSITYSQNLAPYSIRIDYSMQLNFNGQCNFASSLFFNETKSYFEYRSFNMGQDILKEGDSDDFFSVVNDTTLFFVKTDRETNLIIESEASYDHNRKYLIKDSLINIAWEIMNETKKIDSHLCTKAVCRFKGRNYIAWFTQDLPCNFGPWKLHGLPGAILEVYDDKNEVRFYAKKIANNTRLISDSIPKYKYITRKEFNALCKKNISDMFNRISSKMDRKFKVEVTKSDFKSIELDEE